MRMFSDLTKRTGFSLERVISFCEVAKAGSIAKAAAKAAGKESKQSQYSKQIKELESFFGVELTHKNRRSKNSGLLTPHGEQLRQVAQKSLGALEDFVLQVTSGRTSCRLAAGNSLLTWLIIPLLAKKQEEFSDIEFHLTDMDTTDTLNALCARELDIGLVRTSAIDSPLLESSTVRSVSYVIATPKGWGTKLEKNFSALPFAVIEASEQLEDLRRAIQKSITTGKMPSPEKYVCRDACQCLEFVRSGKAAAIVPEIAPLKDLDLVRPPWLKTFERKISLVWHRELKDNKIRVFDVLQTVKASLTRK
jgi:DNA-binding transcriptional LysR family regulator